MHRVQMTYETASQIDKMGQRVFSGDEGTFERYPEAFLHEDAAKIVFLGGLPLTTTKEKIVSYLKRFGELERIVLPRDPISKRIKGYGKATYKESQSAQLALSHEAHWLKGIRFGVMRWLDSPDYEKLRKNLSQRKVYVKHRPQHTKEALLSYFEQFGHVEAIDMRLSFSSNKPRNFCYVVFESADDALRVVNSSEHLLNGLPLLCEMCKPNKKHIEKFTAGADSSNTSLLGLSDHQALPSKGGSILVDGFDNPKPDRACESERWTRFKRGFGDLPLNPVPENHPLDCLSDHNLVKIQNSQISESNIFASQCNSEKESRNLCNPPLTGKYAERKPSRQGSQLEGPTSRNEYFLAQIICKPTSLKYPRAVVSQINERHEASNGLILFSFTRARCL
jgi:RNA recognition motif-containing protein